MKNFLESPGLTNILFAAFLAVIGYVFVEHTRMPWHGTVGTDLVEMKAEIMAAHKDIERIIRALDLDDNGGGK